MDTTVKLVERLVKVAKCLGIKGYKIQGSYRKQEGIGEEEVTARRSKLIEIFKRSYR